MRRSLGAGLAAVLVAGRVWLPSTLSGQQTTFRSTSDLVTVDVRVRAGGSAVAGLAVADFVVLDNGVPQQVERVDAEAIPLDVTLLVDVGARTVGALSGPAPTAPIATRVLEDVRRIASMLGTGDRLQLMAIDTYTTEVFPMRPATTPISPTNIEGFATRGLSSIYDAVVTAMLAPADPSRRHLIVLWTKGVDSISASDAAAVQEVARRTDALVHVVPRDAVPPSLRGPEPLARTWAPFHRGDMTVLANAAVLTGGDVHGDGGNVDIAATFKDIFDEFRRGYVLRYAPQGVNRDGWHELTVRVPRLPAAEIRARRGYAVEPEPSTRGDVTRAAATPSPGVDTVTAESLIEAFGRNDHAALRNALRTWRQPAKVIRDVKALGVLWPNAPRREAIFVLEVAMAALAGRDEAAAKEAADWLETYDRYIRHPVGPDDFECTWYWAEVAGLQGTARPVAAKSFAERAVLRCPAEGRLRLALGTIAEETLSVLLAARQPDSGRIPAELPGVTQALQDYQTAMAYPDVSAEAHVRAAWLAYRTGQKATALDWLNAVDASDGDRVVRYFGQLVRGQVVRDDGRLDEAAAAFQAALALWPDAQSARSALMTVSILQGRPDQAATLSEAIQTAPETAIDPWWFYAQGDYRVYPTIVTRLLEMAR